MRTFEVFLLIVLSLPILSLFFNRKKRQSWFTWQSVIIFATFLLHAFFEDFRWQMTFAYLVVAFVVIRSGLNILQLSKKPKTYVSKLIARIGRGVVAIICLLFLIFSGLLSYLFPVPKMPSPTGPFAVGSTYLHVIDSARAELITEDTTDFRSLWVQVWYPAEHTRSSERLPILPESNLYMGQIFKRFGMPAFASRHLPLIKSHSFLDAPIKQGEEAFPIILYSHGFTGNLSDNTQKMEALASHGYVVFSVAHAYNTQLGKRDDGSWLTLDDENTIRNVNVLSDTALKRSIRSDLDHLFDSIKSPQFLTQENRLVIDSLYDILYENPRQYLHTHAQDLSSVLNEISLLQNGEKESQFFEKLNLDKVGAMGSSFGGPTAAIFAATDDRCRAAINIDGTQFGLLYRYQINKPYMCFGGAMSWDVDTGKTDFENIGNAHPYYRISIKNASHMNIADQWFSTSIHRQRGVFGLGSIEPHRCYDIYNTYVLAFFDQHVKGGEQTLLEGENRFEEVKFIRHE